VPVKTVADLIALAKSKPGTLNYAAGTIGATPHLAAELFKYMAGIDLVRRNLLAHFAGQRLITPIPA